MRLANLVVDIGSTMCLAFGAYSLGQARGYRKGLKLHVAFLDELQRRLQQRRLAELRGDDD